MKGPWRALVAGALVALLTGCQRPGAVPEAAAGASTRKVRIFLIALEGVGRSDPRIGCGDRAVAVEVELPRAQPALRGSLEALFEAGNRYDGAGFYNALANSPLRIQRIERTGNRARIDLGGYLELGGECDSPRILAQLTETAAQFRDVDQADFFLDGKPLRELLSGRG